jgi:ABC-type nickel/cobalt efflux system permease component RcnA
MRAARNTFTSCLLLVAVLCLGANRAWAHPMGNFSVSHFAKVTVDAESVTILYLLDFAEIPTYQDIRQYGLSPNSGDPSVAAYLAKQSEALRDGITVEDGGRPLHLECVSRKAIFAEGAGGLPTMKIGFTYRAYLPPSNDPAAHKLTYTDGNYSGHSGWKEIVVLSGSGASVINSSAPSADRSQELTNYPTDLLNSPPQALTASVEFRVAAPRVQDSEPTRPAVAASRSSTANESALPKAPTKRNAHTKSAVPVPQAVREQPHQALDQPQSAQLSATPLRANAQSTPRNRFTQLIATKEKPGLWVLLSAAFIAAGLGALHALEPGHGKTLVAAYLVGSRGKARHAVLLGLVVTAAHTAGVYLLGAIALYASRYIVPEQLYPWLGAISGCTVAGLGVFIFLRHLTGDSGDHSHDSREKHSHWFSAMFRKPSDPLSRSIPENSSAKPVSLGQLCALGITGGIVPCPAALVVLLSAFSLHRIGFGLFLITAFSLGLAAVLVVVGLGMVYAKQFLTSIKPAGPFQRYLPLFSSAFMVVLGVGIAASAFGYVYGSGIALISKEKLLPFVTVMLLGLFLGVRHSTDPDHVVAVSTIVSRQGSIKSAATIGALWGLGHTLTLFLVGAAIILFKVVIPPRLGLAMEFSVALMLILLGVLNLTGLMKSITNRFTPAAMSSAGTGIFERTLGTLGKFQTFRPFVVGLVHGLAGSAAVALLVLSTIKSPFWATGYLLVFGAGTLAGMMVMTTAMSLPLSYTSKRYATVGRFITVTSGVISIAFGLFLVYQIGIADGLFAAQPHWIPS